MNKPENLTLHHYWEANSSEERKVIIENVFAFMDQLQKEMDKIQKENEWNSDIESMPLRTDLLFFSDNEVKFGYFESNTESRLENIHEVITHDGDGLKYDRSEILKWRFLPKP